MQIQEFERFYKILMSNAPEGYTPWFFPCAKGSKNPCPEAILKINPNSKGSWHHEDARLNKEQCIEHIKQGYNIGISARKDDALIIGDIDTFEYLKQVPKKTLTATSRKRSGCHFFGWDKDGSAKINLPTDHGEIRSENQYVLCSGSYVGFNLESEKDKKAFDELPKKAREDKMLGYYTVLNPTVPRKLYFNDLPEFFKKEQIENIESEVKREVNEFKGEGKYSELFKLKVSDIVGLIPANKRTGHPLHESDTDSNFSLSKDGCLCHCWRHLVTLNAVQYLCVKTGYSKCKDAGTPHKSDRKSKIKGDKKALEVAYKEAVKLELIKEYKSTKSDIEKIIKSFYSKQDLVKQLLEVQPIYYDENKIWWIWINNEFKWKITDETDILNFVSNLSGADTINSKERTEILETIRQTSRQKKPKEIEKTWIQFRDTIVNIKTGEELKASSEYFVTNPIPYGLNNERNIETPVMNKIFGEWVGKENIQKLYEILAYSLIPDYPIHRIFCFIGGGMNGKSCFLSLLRKFIGKDNCCSTELDTLLNSRFEVTRLHKKLVCQMGETNFNELNKTSILKKLSGGDLIGFEYKNKNPFEEVNYAKIIIATNNLPTTTDKTIGFYRRWMIVDFPNQFSEKKDILEDIPESEYMALTVKCSKILKNLLKKRGFTNEGDVNERMKAYEDKSNPLDKFFKENIVEDYSSHIWKWEFAERLKDWCRSNNFRELSQNDVSKRMKNNNIEEKKKFNGDDKGTRWMAWDGIKWK